MVASLVVRENSQERIEELCAELNRALDQRKQINSDRIRRLLNSHIRDLKAELIVIGRL